jgi:hypothetical protein
MVMVADLGAAKAAEKALGTIPASCRLRCTPLGD